MLSSSRGFRWVTYLTMSMALVGCAENAKVHKASGTVKFPDGQPLAGAWVEFRPVAGETKHSARAHVAEDGSFHLTTFASIDGALPGKHQVLLVPPVPTGPVEIGNGAEFPEVIHRRFRSFETSGLEFTVTDDEASNHFDIIVQKPNM